MKAQYREIVTREVNAVCTAYASALNVCFGEPIVERGGACTSSLASGGFIGVRAPPRETEEPVVRPYWLVTHIDAACAAAVQAGGVIAHEPVEISGHGRFAVYL